MNTIIDKIRAEIERQIADLQHKEDRAWDSMDEYGDEDAMWYQGGRKSLVRLLSFLDTLESEKPIGGLEEEMAKFIETFGWGKTKHLAEKELISATARHFAQWGAERQKEQDDKELSDLLTIAHLQGADQMKEQMLKEAVEGVVIKTGKHTSVRYPSFYGTDRYFYGIADNQFKPGDKVRIIIVKED